MTQKEIAKKCNVTQATVSLWLYGYTTPKTKSSMILKDSFKFPLKIWGNPLFIDDFLKQKNLTHLKRSINAKHNTRTMGD